MTPGERCDEILRLIDEGLSGCIPAAGPARRSRRPVRGAASSRPRQPGELAADGPGEEPLAATA